MKIFMTIMLVAALINLPACSSIRGNVVPEKGPTMESIYDSMGNDNPDFSDALSTQNLSTIRQTTGSDQPTNKNSIPGFRQLPNPELTLYVYPHLAGESQVPVPGYNTAFSAYTQTYYALPQE